MLIRVVINSRISYMVIQSRVVIRRNWVKYFGANNSVTLGAKL